jgi:quercetin dioxygenase-like cupin family protein
MQQRRRKKKKSFGVQMKALREESDLTLEVLANDTGCSPERLAEIEADKVLPTVSEVIRISKRLSVDPGSFLSAETEEANRRKIQAYEKRTEAYAYTPLTPGAKTKHMKAFRVSIDPHSDHESAVDYQHEGEEFIYVLQGILEVQIGDHHKTLEPGGSIHFNSGIKHKLRNVSEKSMELIVVVYTP